MCPRYIKSEEVKFEKNDKAWMEGVEQHLAGLNYQL